jgi:hypothetical protein
VVAQRHHRAADLPGPRGGQVFLGDLGGGVDAARVQRRGLVDQVRGEPVAAARAGGLEPPGGQVRPVAGERPHRAVPRTGIRAFAVDDHRAGQHQTSYVRPGHLGQQHRRSQVVAADVLRQVVEVDPEAHHGRLVHDDVDPAERARQSRPVAQVDPPHRDTGDGRGQRRAMGRRMAQVQNGHVVASRRAATT